MRGGQYSYECGEKLSGHLQLEALEDRCLPSGYIIAGLGTLGGPGSSAAGINNSGQVVGYSQTGGNFIYHAFLYDGSMHDLGTLGGKFSQANAINDRGQIVGYSSTASAPEFETDAFLYDNGSMIDLNSLLPAGSDFARLALASAINDRGQIVGYGITTGGQAHAFLLTPLSSESGAQPVSPSGDSRSLAGAAIVGSGSASSGPTSAQAQPSPASIAAGGAEDGQGVGGGVYNLGTFDLDAASFVVGNLASASNDNVYGSITPL